MACLARQRASLSPGFRPGYPGSPSLKVAPSGRSPESLIPAALQPRPQAARGEAPTRCGSLRTAVWRPKEWTRRLGHPDTLQSSALQGSPEPLLQALAPSHQAGRFPGAATLPVVLRWGGMTTSSCSPGPHPAELRAGGGTGLPSSCADQLLALGKFQSFLCLGLLVCKMGLQSPDVSH